MKTYVIKYTLKSNNHTHSILFCDGEYFGDIDKVAQAARFPQKISYWRSEWKKYLKGIKSVQFYKLDCVPFEFLEELNDIEQKFEKHDYKAFSIRRGKEFSAKCLYNNIMAHSYRQLINIILGNMFNYYTPRKNDSDTNDNE